MVLPYKDDGKERRTEILGAVSREDDEGAKKSISDIDEASLPLEEGERR